MRLHLHIHTHICAYHKFALFGGVVALHFIISWCPRRAGRRLPNIQYIQRPHCLGAATAAEMGHGGQCPHCAGGEPPPEPFWPLFGAKAPRKQPVCPYLSLIYPGPCTLVDRLFFFCQSRSNRLKILKTNVRVGG